MADSKYCYKGTDVLKNKFHIRDFDLLQETERNYTMLRLLELEDRPVRGRFDFDHLCEIHRYIFQDIYDFAGKVRTVDIAKSNLFCPVKHLSAQADDVFHNLAKEDYLENLEKDEMAERLAYYFGEINALHPFREGNGRAQREFLRELALYNKYTLRLQNVSPDEMLEASKETFVRNYDRMTAIFHKALSTI